MYSIGSTKTKYLLFAFVLFIFMICSCTPSTWYFPAKGYTLESQVNANINGQSWNVQPRYFFQNGLTNVNSNVFPNDTIKSSVLSRHQRGDSARIDFISLNFTKVYQPYRPPLSSVYESYSQDDFICEFAVPRKLSSLPYQSSTCYMFSFKQARRKISVSSTMARNGIQYAWNSEDSAIYMSLKSKQIDDARLTIEKYDTDNCLISGTLRISLKSSSNAIDVKECTFVDVPLERSWYR